MPYLVCLAALPSRRVKFLILSLDIHPHPCYIGCRKDGGNMERRKLCNACNTTKSVYDFALNKSMRDGLQAYCKECNRKMQRAYRDQNLERWAGKDPYTEEAE